MKTRIVFPLIVESIPGSDRYVRLAEDFVIFSVVLGGIVRVPRGMVFDLESVPLLRGTCPEAGCAHDYLCRIDSDPEVSKRVAAEVYFEIMDYVYSLDDSKSIKGLPDKALDAGRKWVKWLFVYAWPGYFHRYKVGSTYKEIAG